MFDDNVETKGVTTKSKVKKKNMPSAIEMGSAGNALPAMANSTRVITSPCASTYRMEWAS